MKRRKSQAGSALFLILIGVALFAALSYVVANMMRGGDPNSIADDKARLYADEILNYGRALRQAAQNLKISSGCADANISFEDTALAGYTHAPAVADNCKVFHKDGGGITYLAPAAEWLDTTSPAPVLRGYWYFPADTCIAGIGSVASGVDCSIDGTDNESLIVVLPYIKRQICIELNKALGVANPGGVPPQETNGGWVTGSGKFDGTQSDGEILDQEGQRAGCFEGSAANTPPTRTYHFYQVLVAR
ncbi:MAG: hypothetical protein IT558_04620 [Alphaproteobacteria bacterium]|nr:hypothetical protein [Alphaproteobacteria bacterium]